MDNLPPTDKPVVMISGDVVDLTKMVHALREDKNAMREAIMHAWNAASIQEVAEHLAPIIRDRRFDREDANA